MIGSDRPGVRADQFESTKKLRELLACPACGNRLSFVVGSICCLGCDRRYDEEQGVPILLQDESRTAYKEQQARSHDKAGSAADSEFEMTRPIGAPAFYGWLLEYKQRASVEWPVSVDPGDVALVSCGGSGMDAHFLASKGAGVISVDISLGAAIRTMERARHYGLPVISVVGDAERLPVLDAAADLSYVHDGLHHLEDPASAIDELGRVSRRDITITEPARALATAVAVKLGVSEEVEESGNTVRRFTVDELEHQLRSQGFTELASRRYAMWYRHSPAWLARLLSRKRMRPVGIVAYHGANTILGSVGNKVSIRGRKVLSGSVVPPA
jgi:uncharacterized protein YbaR (Trm112 family)